MTPLERRLAAHSRTCPDIEMCLTCAAHGELLVRAGRIKRVEGERDEARASLSSLATVAELARSGLASAIAIAMDGDPAGELARDLADIDPPAGAGEDTVLVPLLRLPMRQDTPRNAPTSAAATAEAGQTAPTT